jgi:hypothetical protein
MLQSSTGNTAPPLRKRTGGGGLYQGITAAPSHHSHLEWIPRLEASTSKATPGATWATLLQALLTKLQGRSTLACHKKTTEATLREA